MTGRLQPDKDRAGSDRGSIAPLVPIVILVLFLLGGLLVDGARVLNARGDAEAYAEEAARAGATAVDPTSAALKLDQSKADTRLRAYCASVNHQAHADVDVSSCLPDPAGEFSAAKTCDGSMQQIVVHAQVKVAVDSSFLGVFGFSTFTVSRSAQARPFEGPALNPEGRC